MKLLVLLALVCKITAYDDCTPAADGSQNCGQLCFSYIDSTASSEDRANIRWKCIESNQVCCCSVNAGKSYFANRIPQQDICYPPSATPAPTPAPGCDYEACRSACESVLLLVYSCNAPGEPSNQCRLYSAMYDMWITPSSAQYYHETKPGFY